MRPRPSGLVGLLAAAALLLVSVPAAQALDAATLRAVLARELRGTSAFSGAYVRDVDAAGPTSALFARNEDVARIPASVQKLYTTATALLRFGPDARLVTTVAGDGFLDPDGVWRGDLYLRGGGDPTLDRARVVRLARALAVERGVVRVDGAVRADETAFDARRGATRTGFAYDRDVGGVLSAVAVSRGFSHDGSPAREAARRLAAALRAEGVPVSGRSEGGVTPSGAAELAAAESPPMAGLALATNAPSDNFAAEMLLKGLGARFGGLGSTPAGAGVVREELARIGVHPRIADGSGLSRANRTTPRQVVRLLERMHRQEVAAAFEGSLAVAGRTGTIRRRMRGTAAQDRCRAKTGTLPDVSALAGLCTTTGGRTVAFAFLMNRTWPFSARRAQDRMTAAIARLEGQSPAGPLPSSNPSKPGSSSTFTPRRSAFSSLDPALAPATT
jgi:D-alanyl-D-alanine carboxypeptidase/D-alanyl-D-alanine-endopeptidase (penicillin-binding protein 4)